MGWGGLGGRVSDSRSRGPKPPTAVSFTATYVCLSEETLKAVGPLYRVSMPGDVKDPTQGVNV